MVQREIRMNYLICNDDDTTHDSAECLATCGTYVKCRGTLVASRPAYDNGQTKPRHHHTGPTLPIATTITKNIENVEISSHEIYHMVKVLKQWANYQ